jgi:hypothetical protein
VLPGASAFLQRVSTPVTILLFNPHKLTLPPDRCRQPTFGFGMDDRHFLYVLPGHIPHRKLTHASHVPAATNVYAPKVLSVCGLPLPPLGLVTSSDVANGKPHPAPYLAGARRLGVDPKNCKPILLVVTCFKFQV